MASTLIARWLGEARAAAIPILDHASVAEAREHTRAEGQRVGLTGERLERLVAAVSELATNQLVHAAGGLVLVRECERAAVAGLEVVAADRGKGLADPARALAGLGKTSGSLGIGVSAVRRAADELDIDVRMEEGSCVWIRKFAAPVRRGREVGVYALPKIGERVSGDDATFVRDEHGLVLALADGLGHGEAARDASRTIVDDVVRHPGRDLVSMIHSLDELARPTRGAALTIVRIEDAAQRAHAAAVGNVMATWQIGPSAHQFGSTAWTVGGPARTQRPVRPDTSEAPFGAVFVLFSDGVSRSARVDPSRLHDHPVEIAQHLAAEHGRGTDDVTVVVAR